MFYDVLIGKIKQKKALIRKTKEEMLKFFNTTFIFLQQILKFFNISCTQLQALHFSYSSYLSSSSYLSYPMLPAKLPHHCPKI